MPPLTYWFKAALYQGESIGPCPYGDKIGNFDLRNSSLPNVVNTQVSTAFVSSLVITGLSIKENYATNPNYPSHHAVNAGAYADQLRLRGRRSTRRALLCLNGLDFLCDWCLTLEAVQPTSNTVQHNGKMLLQIVKRVL